jgi:protocatechuate 3,4-dioxygenase beta subunit
MSHDDTIDAGHDAETDHHAGLCRDLRVLRGRLDRRRLLELAAWLGAAAAGCGGSSSSDGAGDGGSGLSDAGNLASDGSCTVIPEETLGPYPGDGSNGPDALSLSGIVRSDIREGIAGATGTATGVPLVVKLRLMDTGCTPLPGFAVYLWHCDQQGRYSMYSSGVENENYLRGVQEADDDGVVTFTTIFPACYSGRWPHIHFEVYESLAAAGAYANKLATSQLALPASSCDEVFATSGYEASVNNFSRISLASDNVFRDGAELETPSISGDVATGFTVTLDVAVPI